MYCASHLLHCTDIFILPQFYSILLSYIFYTLLHILRAGNMKIESQRVYGSENMKIQHYESVCIKRHALTLSTGEY